MYQIKTKYREQNYYWYGDGIYWKLTDYTAKVFDSFKDAEEELKHIKSLNTWASEHVEIVKGNVFKKIAHIRLVRGIK